ncbi:MAG: STAS domain-containing protein [Planctomycetaceae bacterium]
MTAANTEAPEVFQTERAGDVLIVLPQPSARTFGEAEVSHRLAGLLAEYRASGAVHAVVDFAGVPYFGSSLLEAVRTLWNEVRARSGRVALCGVAPLGRDVLHVAKYDTVWLLCATRDEALAAVHQEPAAG